MAFCQECGSLIPDGASYCTSCGKAVEDTAHTIGGSNNSRMDAYAGIANTSSAKQECHFEISEGEKIVRKYVCSQLSFPTCKGTMFVTNKRLIFSGKGVQSRVTKEVALDSVSGLDSYYGTNIKFLPIIVGVIMAMIGVYMLFGGVLQIPGMVALIIGGLIAALLGYRKVFYLVVYSSKASGTPIDIGGNPNSVIGNGAMYSVVGYPTSDTDRMLDELGALVQDLQTMGDHAIDKWNKNFTQY